MRFETDVGQYKNKKRTQVSKWPQDYFFHIQEYLTKYKINCTFNHKKKAMKSIFLIVCLALSPFVYGQTTPNKTIQGSTQSNFSIILKDQFILTGNKISENESTIWFRDFTLGEISLQKSNILKVSELKGDLFVELILNDGKTILGKLASKTESTLSILTQNLGQITLSKSAIKSIKIIEDGQIKNGKYLFPNPHPTRYFFGPSAIPLKKGEKYFQNAYLLSNSIQIGLSDQFSIGGGVVIPILFYITPKFGKKVSENVHVGGGILIASSLISNLNLGVGVGYASLTLGSNENNATLNVGWGATKGDSYDAINNTTKTSWSFANKPMFTFSGMTRISRRCMLVSENWLFAVNEYTYDSKMQANGITNNYNGVMSGGVRIMLEKSSFDFGILSPIGGSTSAMGIPYIDYVIKF